MTVHLTVQAAAAHAVAYKDRDASATLVLKMAVREAMDSIREGHGEDARRTLLRAGSSAERILGRGAR